MSDLRPDDSDFSERSSLPLDLVDIHDRLTGDGARWRWRAPDGADLAAWARDVLEHEANPRSRNRWSTGARRLSEQWLAHAEPAELFSPGPKGPRNDMTMTRIRGYIGVAAAVLVVGLIAALLTRGVANRSGTGAGSGATPTPGPVGTPTLQPSNQNWQPSMLPVVAPSDPATVYKLGSNTLLRSSDGGKTYATESLPTTDLTSVDDASLAVSPLGANTVFVTMSGRKDGQDCMPTQPYPATAMHGGIDASGYVPCSEQYMSVDGGHTWTRPTLPVQGVFGSVSMMREQQSVIGTQSYVFQAQGQRIYAAMGYGVQSGAIMASEAVRLVASDDGGLTWRLIDSQLASATQFVCDFAAAPSSSTVYAVVEGQSCGNESFPSMTLWRSADGGQSWTRVRTLPTNVESGFVVGDNGELYIYMHQVSVSSNAATGTESPADAMVSLDGGATFSSAPSSGLPAKATLMGPLGVLSDGSVIYAAVSPGPEAGQSTVGVYTWKKGDGAWTNIVHPSATMSVAAVTVTPPATGATTQAVSIISETGVVSTVQIAIG